MKTPAWERLPEGVREKAIEILQNALPDAWREDVCDAIRRGELRELAADLGVREILRNGGIRPRDLPDDVDALKAAAAPSA